MEDNLNISRSHADNSISVNEYVKPDNSGLIAHHDLVIEEVNKREKDGMKLGDGKPHESVNCPETGMSASDVEILDKHEIGSGRKHYRFNLDAFFKILDDPKLSDNRQIVSYEQDELNDTRRKRGHTEGVQLGQAGRWGTFKAGRERNKKTWDVLLTAIEESGIQLSEEEKAELFGDAITNKDPMTVKHLKALKPKILDIKIESADDFLEKKLKTEIISKNGIEAYNNLLSRIGDLIKNNITSILKDIQYICDKFNEEENRLSLDTEKRFCTDFCIKEDNKYIFTHKSLQNGLKTILLMLQKDKALDDIKYSYYEFPLRFMSYGNMNMAQYEYNKSFYPENED